MRDRCSATTAQCSSDYLPPAGAVVWTSHQHIYTSLYFPELENLTPFCRLEYPAMTTDDYRFGHPRCTLPQLLSASRRPTQFSPALHPVQARGPETSRWCQREVGANRTMWRSMGFRWNPASAVSLKSR